MKVAVWIIAACAVIATGVYTLTQVSTAGASAKAEFASCKSCKFD